MWRSDIASLPLSLSRSWALHFFVIPLPSLFPLTLLSILFLLSCLPSLFTRPPPSLSPLSITLSLTFSILQNRNALPDVSVAEGSAVENKWRPVRSFVANGTKMQAQENQIRRQVFMFILVMRCKSFLAWVSSSFLSRIFFLFSGNIFLCQFRPPLDMSPNIFLMESFLLVWPFRRHCGKGPPNGVHTP